MVKKMNIDMRKYIIDNFKEGDIIVLPETSNDIMDELRQASGIIVEKEGISLIYPNLQDK